MINIRLCRAWSKSILILYLHLLDYFQRLLPLSSLSLLELITLRVLSELDQSHTQIDSIFLHKLHTLLLSQQGKHLPWLYLIIELIEIRKKETLKSV